MKKQKNLMRNEMQLQHYSPSTARCYLNGKVPSDNMHVWADAIKKEYWINLFNIAIEDLQKGYYISNKCKKNDIQYWLEQIKMVEEFEVNWQPTTYRVRVDNEVVATGILPNEIVDVFADYRLNKYPNHHVSFWQEQ